VAMRMRTTLILCLLSVSFGVGSLSLVAVHSILRKQIRADVAADLQRSIVTYRNIREQQQQTLEREASLLAALPVLKSLMTTTDPRTIEDGAAGFSLLSGGDLFALAGPDGAAIAVYEDGTSTGGDDPRALPGPTVFAGAQQHWVLLHGRLYAVAAQPLYFGSADNGTRLGYVLLGSSVNRRMAQEVSQVAAAEVIFYANGTRVATTLDEHDAALEGMHPMVSYTPLGQDIWMGSEHFVGAAALLSGPSDPAVQLVVLKSFDQASAYLMRLNRVLLALGALLLALSALFAIYLAATITRPLDRLVAGARALGAGNFDYQLRHGGAKEIRELAEAFDRMRRRLRDTRQELVAAERMATIGRMASSISHDLRHYLSAVYANAEFLGYASADAKERVELLTEIRQGVRGMTDLIESLLLFSRTGQPLQLSWESLPFLVERSVALVRAHPDAQNVAFAVEPMPPIEVWTDTLKIERALYNLLLNGCQAARQGAGPAQIRVSLSDEGGHCCVRVTDNGPGVPESVRKALFQPFVSEGKASGIGLGLALAHKIAQEHGGEVRLECSEPGKTVFALSLAKSGLRELAAAAQSQDAPVAVP
jgi:signal transduction histidine kinase